MSIEQLILIIHFYLKNKLGQHISLKSECMLLWYKCYTIIIAIRYVYFRG